MINMTVEIPVNIVRVTAVLQDVVVPLTTPPKVVKIKTVDRFRIKHWQVLPKRYWLTA